MPQQWDPVSVCPLVDVEVALDINEFVEGRVAVGGLLGDSSVIRLCVADGLHRVASFFSHHLPEVVGCLPARRVADFRGYIITVDVIARRTAAGISDEPRSRPARFLCQANLDAHPQLWVRFVGRHTTDWQLLDDLGELAEPVTGMLHSLRTHQRDYP